MTGNNIHHFKSITEFHRYRNLPKPEHPLVSVIRFEDMSGWEENGSHTLIHDFYSIALKRNFQGKIKYGQQEYDFDEGIMTFMSPSQVLRIETGKNGTAKHAGWLLLFHPDFLWKSNLAKTIRQYEFFDYSVKEALYLSEKEELIIGSIFENIRDEYHENIDRFTQALILSRLESLLTYADRFYQRQFITRQVSSHQIIERFEGVVNDYFASKELSQNGLPSVQNIAEQLNVSSGYLSELLKALTGMPAQQHLHARLIDKAKEKLSTSTLSVGEIAYALGFEHPQSFSKLFRIKTSLSPVEFRKSYANAAPE